MMPRACVLHAVRHPADTSLSSFQQSFRPQSIPWSFNLTRERRRRRRARARVWPAILSVWAFWPRPVHQAANAHVALVACF